MRYTMKISLFSYFIILPLASPFGLGIHAGTAVPTLQNGSKVNISPSHHPKSHPTSSTTIHASHEPVESLMTNPIDKDGTDRARVISRLLFSYATPLIKKSVSSNLELSDVFPIEKHRKMKYQVSNLENKYAKYKSKARRHLDDLRSFSSKGSARGNANLKSKINERIAKSESLILTKSLLSHQKKELLFTGSLRLLNTVIQAFPALLIARLLRLIEAGDVHHLSKPLKAAFALIAVLSVKTIVENAYFNSICRMAASTRGSLSGLIFDKSLRLSANRVKSFQKKGSMDLGTGGVLNLMQSDASIIESTALQLHTIWDGILQIFIFSTLLYRTMGPCVLWGIACLLITIPTNSLTLRLLNRLNKLESAAKDSRTKKTSEAISNMKLLKLQGWEKHFKKMIEKDREEELIRHVQRGCLRALNSAITNAVPSIVLVVTLTAYKKSGGPILASTIFTAISLFNQLRFPLFFYPMVVDSLANGKNAIRRISSYLCEEDLTPYVQKLSKKEEEGGGIEMKNGNFLWSSAKMGQEKGGDLNLAPALCGAEVTVHAGEVVAVVGGVGSGKSALVKALLGELEPVPRMIVDQESEESLPSKVKRKSPPIGDFPSVKSKGDIAYSAQEAWLSAGTIRDAILFGRSYDHELYMSAIYDSCLDDDFKMGTLSHNTQVGEDGSSLSGGQRARVQLARTIYDNRSGVYLLDDPLSALDASVGATVFERLKRRIKKNGVAAVFVTNDVSLPRRCDRVILMGRSTKEANPCSRVIDVGSYDELISRGHNLRSFSINELPSPGTESNIKNNSDDVIKIHHKQEDRHDKLPACDDFIKNSTETFYFDPPKDESDKDETRSIGTMDDKISTGAVPVSAYTTYLKAIKNPVLIIAALSFYFIANGAQFYQQYVVAKWTEIGIGSGIATSLGDRYLRSLIYAAGVVSVSLWLRSFIVMLAGTRASKFLHSRMVATVFSAPVSFFDANPSGQLLSRFGKELESVDRGVPDGFGSVLYCFIQIFITIIGLSSVSPGMILPISLAGLFYISTMSKFRPAARDLKIFESKSRSPIYTHFGEALRGVEAIRSFSHSPDIWSSRLKYLTDENIGVYSSLKALDRWLSIRLEGSGNLVVLAAAVTSIFLTRAGRLKAGSAGWGLTQTLAITGLLTWAVRVVIDLESQMMSVMRVAEVSNIDISGENSIHVPCEKEKPGEALKGMLSNNAIFTSPSNDCSLVNSGWPWRGEVKFRNVSMRYNSASPRVLKNVTIDIAPGNTLGIVGRTGSGKSTLLLTLFRIFEIEEGGSISIDGVDIRSVSLQTLRDSISIIPQNPVLFTGTVLYNLDVTGRTAPEDAWLALESASPDLAKQFKMSGLGLNTPITEGGKNLSIGQRQLICLARALLRKSKILVLDEATSSVDGSTDAQVQDTIRNEFVKKGISVITVAHRLDTVLGSDNIAVLGDGEVIEYGSPGYLLTLSNGELRKLVDADLRNKKKGAKAPIQGW